MTGRSDPDLLADRLGGDGDALYARLMAAHEGLSDEASAALNARLVLILMNMVGERASIEAAIALAVRCGGAPTAVGRPAAG